MVNSRTPGQQIDPLQRAQGIILKTYVQGGVFGDGWGRRRGEGCVDVGVEDGRRAFGTTGRGGDEVRVIGHVEMGVVLGGPYAHATGII
jgi:hypothetical protein